MALTTRSGSTRANRSEIPAFVTSFSLILALLTFVSCVTSTVPATPPAPAPVRVELDDKGRAAGLEDPTWLGNLKRGAFRTGDFVEGEGDLLLFAASADAKNLQTAELLAARVELSAAFARTLAYRADLAMSGATPGLLERNAYRRLTERFAKLLSESSFAGIRREDDWWEHIRPSGLFGLPGPPAYRYYVLGSISAASLRPRIMELLELFESGLPPEEMKTGNPGRIREAIDRAFPLR